MLILENRYDPADEQIEDYVQMYIEWGHLALFGAAAPGILVLAFITNFIETRTDGYAPFHAHTQIHKHRDCAFFTC